MKKISFKFEEQKDEDTWVPNNSIDNFKVETTLTDPKDLLPLVQDSIDFHWNSKLRAHEYPRRVTEIVKVEDYIAPEPDRYSWEEDEDEDDEYYEF